MSKNNASSSIRGYTFQANAAVVLIIDFFDRFKAVRLEGNLQDIEIELDDGSYVLAQAKAIEKPSTDFRNVLARLDSSIKSLSAACANANICNCVYITNSLNPFNMKEGYGSYSYGAFKHFCDFSKEEKGVIEKYVNELDSKMELDKFILRVVLFEGTENIEKFKYVILQIENFISHFDLNTPGLAGELHRLWIEELFENGENFAIEQKLSKKDIVWPIIVILTDINKTETSFFNNFDDAIYEEVKERYPGIINTCSERFSFVTKVLKDYKSFGSSKSHASKTIDFVNNRWVDYIDEFSLDDLDDEIAEALTKFVLFNIVSKWTKISRVKDRANLCI